METSEIMPVAYAAIGALVFLGCCVWAVVESDGEEDWGERGFQISGGVLGGALAGLAWPVVLAGGVVAGIVWVASKPILKRRQQERADQPIDGDYVVAVMDDGSTLDGIVGGSVTYLITADGHAEFDPDRDVWRKIERVKAVR